MNIPLTPLFIALISTFISISMLRPFAINIGLVDYPSHRKPHTGSIPLIGGLAMYLGVIVSILTTSIDLNYFNYFILSTMIVVFVGVLDDHQNISVGIRILFQALAAFIVAEVAGINISFFGDLFGRGDIYIQKWPIFISVLAIIAGMNAVNMLDGINGLAGGSALVTFGSIAYLAIGADSHLNLMIALIFCMVIPIFLVDNLCIFRSKKYRIFMGDAGSMLLGLSIAWLLIDLTQGNNKAFSPVTALWIFSIPLIELVSSIFRRILRGKSPFEADLNHMHHLLNSSGFSENKTLIIILAASLGMSIFGIMGELYNIDEWKMFSGFLLVFLTYFVICNRLSKK